MRPKLVAIKVSGGHLVPVIMRASSRGRRRRDFEASIISRATTPARARHQHPVDHGLAVELGRRGQGFGAAGRGPNRAQQRELEELRAALARPYGHEGDPVVLAWLAGPRVQQ
jgi:hypothetical protein